MRNSLLFVALRTAAWLLRFLPLPLVYGLARLAGRCSYYLVSGARAAASQNLAIVLAQPEAGPVVQAAVRRIFEHDAMNWVDTLRIPTLTPDEIAGMVTVEDWPVVESAIGEGRGLIVATLHLGNFDLVGQIVAARGYRLTVPVETMRPAGLFEFLVKQRASKGIRLVPIEHAARHLVRALRARELIGVAVDRHLAGRTLLVNLFGRPAVLPVGPVALARRTGAPLVLGAGIRTGSGRFEGYVRRVPVAVTGEDAADDAANLASLARAMEELIAKFPDQWMAFAPVWADEPGGNSPVTMSHPTRAAV